MLHAGAAECSDLKCQSCGQHYAWSLQRNCIIRCDHRKPGTVRLSAAAYGSGRRTCHIRKSVLGKERDRAGKEDRCLGHAHRLFYCLVLFILASLFPTQLLGLFTTDQAIIEAGLSYLAIIRFTYFFFAVTQILLATLRCVEIAGVAFGLSVMT